MDNFKPLSFLSPEQVNGVSPLAIYRYRLPFSSAITFAGATLRYREGLIFHCSNEDGERFCEIAPLPGFSRESLDQAQQQLIAWCQGAREQLLFPSVAFGLSTLVFKPEPVQSLPVCRLIGDLNQVDDLSFKPGQLVKCKVARGDWHQEARQINALVKRAPRIKLRLDANRGWDLETATCFAQQVKHKAICFIEEPCRDFESTIEFAAQDLLPVALDETLQQAEWPELIFPGLAALVVKPTLVGDIKRVLMLANLAQFSDLQLVISSAFESSLTLNYLYRLAGTLAPGVAPGLDTRAAFTQDLLQPSQLPGAEVKQCISLDRMELVWQT